MKNTVRFIVISILFFTHSLHANITIHMIGDSTMANKPNPQTNPERGWGQMLPLFFDENVTVNNASVNGRSTKSFIDEGRWNTLLKDLKPGDYVFIQFGHNDQKNKDPKRYTNPYTGYMRNLVKYVNETRAKGATPVLFSSIVRRNFNESGVLEDTHGAYPFVTRYVADKLEVPFVDMQLKSEDLVLSLGQEKSKEIYMWIEPGRNEMYPKGRQDNTHFTEKGATEMARLAVEGLKENNLELTKFLKEPTGKNKTQQ
jgi:lysophospholipase L1-like esterase